MQKVMCDACVHFREPKPVEPFRDIRLASKKMMELRTKWREELVQRARLEHQRLLSGDLFFYEPVALAWCGHYSRITDDERSFVPCDRQNSDDNCPGFEPTAKAHE